MCNIHDDIALFISALVLLVSDDCFCLLFCLYLLSRLLNRLDLTLPLSISLCALKKISLSQMLPDAAGLYHLRKALLFTNAVPINAG